MFVFTKTGRKKAEQYIRELKAKRKEILDAGKDTADDTVIPSPEDILADIEFIGMDDELEYYNSWGVTDNYDADVPIALTYGADFVEKEA